MNNTNQNNKVVALGCRLNFFEAEVIKKQVNDSGLNNTIVVNTCTVTANAHAQSMQMVRKLKKTYPNSKIIVTGCGAQVDPKSFGEMIEVDKVVGNNNKFNIESFLSDKKIEIDQFSPKYDENLTKQEQEYTLPKIKGFENKTRAFIQIQQGCDHRCSFCIVYKARGNSVSVSKEKIIEQIQDAVKFGHNEVVLTGVDISSFNRDIFNGEASKLGLLCKDILNSVVGLKRLRLSSLDPAVVDDNILDLLRNEERFMPHIHLSIQSFNNSVLKNMGRRHSKESAFEWIHALRDANGKIAIGADFICGFPRETEDQFIDTLQSIQKIKIPFLHVFPYSPREGTTAFNMKNVNAVDRKKRANLMSKIGDSIKNDLFKSKINQYVEILVEGNNTGYTQDYCLTKIQGHEIPKGTILMAKVVDFNDKSLMVKI